MNRDQQSLNILSLLRPESPIPVDEETLVADLRGNIGPAQRVEQMMMQAMQTGPVLLSQLQDYQKPHSR